MHILLDVIAQGLRCIVVMVTLWQRNSPKDEIKLGVGRSFRDLPLHCAGCFNDTNGQ